jgi:hypothetical protein
VSLWDARVLQEFKDIFMNSKWKNSDRDKLYHSIGKRTGDQYQQAGNCRGICTDIATILETSNEHLRGKTTV